MHLFQSDFAPKSRVVISVSIRNMHVPEVLNVQMNEKGQKKILLFVCGILLKGEKIALHRREM